MSDVVVSGLSVAAVKGTRLRDASALELTRDGARGNRRFYVIDERDRMLNGKQLGVLQTVEADFSPETGLLTLRFSGGATADAAAGGAAGGPVDGAVDGAVGEMVVGTVELGDVVSTRFFSRPREDRLVVGPWAAALSELAGQPLRLIATGSAVDRGRRGAASLASRASLGRLAEAAGEDVDARRFRMLVEVDGLAAHAEDEWVGTRTRVGGAVIRWHGHVGRCLVTGRDPESGEANLPTLDLLGTYRRGVASTEPLPFGIYGEVLAPGRVSLGDAVVPLDA